jgi:hypothetical protein
MMPSADDARGNNTQIIRTFTMQTMSLRLSYIRMAMAEDRGMFLIVGWAHYDQHSLLEA